MIADVYLEKGQCLVSRNTLQLCLTSVLLISALAFSELLLCGVFDNGGQQYEGKMAQEGYRTEEEVLTEEGYQSEEGD